MAHNAPILCFYKPANASWNQRQQLPPQQAQWLALGSGDTLTLQRAEDALNQRRCAFYFPQEFRQASWQRARALFHNEPELDSLTIKRQREGCYRLTFWHRPAAQVDMEAVLADIRGEAPANVPPSATNGCPFYVMQY